jgi:hypothetical protein
MAKEKDARTGGAGGEKQSREGTRKKKRLAEALRRNLAKRKAAASANAEGNPNDE